MEEDPAVSAAFQSILERSITAWHLLNYVGEDKVHAFSKHIDILRSLSSMEALIESRQFWFFQLRESFMRQDRFMKWSYIWLDWTCMPQVPRSDVQQRYFNKMLWCIPMIVHDCA